MPEIPTGSIDALVTDPPAGISFMGKAWDGDKGGRDQWVEWLTGVMREARRTLKPGAHGFVWAIPRTAHWTMMALENAGFEIRDCCVHLFTSGFPKSLDVSKAIDKAAGAEREIVGYRKQRANSSNSKVPFNASAADKEPITVPATPEAKEWNGWGTALKPSAEFWILVRKPLSELSVASNVLKHRTGAINIDKTRIKTADELDRWPANVFLGDDLGDPSLSRFFWVPKPSTSEKSANIADESIEQTHPTVKPIDLMCYLIRMITPPGGTVLDCFAGSGTTLVAAESMGFRWVGYEINAEYAKIAEARLSQRSLFGESA